MESPFYNLFLFQMIEQNNYGVQEFIFNKKAESNFEAVKNKVWIYIKVFIFGWSYKLVYLESSFKFIFVKGRVCEKWNEGYINH